MQINTMLTTYSTHFKENIYCKKDFLEKLYFKRNNIKMYEKYLKKPLPKL